ncbi:MAG TPA: hypothetical protein PL143_12635 [Rhodocyclaceae bacterium]|nr:hypothetical protein [Rhodocyclaceae bacterium]
MTESTRAGVSAGQATVYHGGSGWSMTLSKRRRSHRMKLTPCAIHDEETRAAPLCFGQRNPMRFKLRAEASDT